MHVNHSRFVELLKEADEGSGLDQKGAITIPRHMEEFCSVQESINLESSHHRHHPLTAVGTATTTLGASGFCRDLPGVNVAARFAGGSSERRKEVMKKGRDAAMEESTVGLVAIVTEIVISGTNFRDRLNCFR
ncbi:hypothetical protein NL676_019221 [Syzygium grande]|nr:hypothetical protein NL676_019221 [Syzygium grande]